MSSIVRTMLVVAGAIVAIPLGSCGYDRDQRAQPFRPAIRAAAVGDDRGAELYQRDCGWCHGSAGQGTDRGPDLVTGTNGPALTHYMLTTGRMPINYPEQPARRGDPLYTSEEVDDIVDYVTAFGQSGPIIPNLGAGNLQAGAELYQENCAACHSVSGIGGALASGKSGAQSGQPIEGVTYIAPGLDAATPTEVAEAMLTGPGTMPVFSYETFDKQEIDSMVRYVDYLQAPRNEGGADIGGVGPVAEGAIGWLVGLGLLLALSRWLGTKVEQR